MTSGKCIVLQHNHDDSSAILIPASRVHQLLSAPTTSDDVEGILDSNAIDTIAFRSKCLHSKAFSEGEHHAVHQVCIRRSTMSEQVIGAHNGLHSEQGALAGEHPGRSKNPVIKVHDVIWLEFEKPDLVKAEAFAHSFGFATVLRTEHELHLRGSDAGAPCVLIRKGQREKFLGPAFVAADDSDLMRLADATGSTVRPLPET